MTLIGRPLSGWDIYDIQEAFHRRMGHKQTIAHMCPLHECRILLEVLGADDLPF